MPVLHVERGTTRRVLCSFFGRMVKEERHNEARHTPLNVVNVVHNEARLMAILWENP